MRLTFTLFSLLLLTCSLEAQKITGIWRGYFTSSPLSREGGVEERYKYEIQIEQLSNNSISGVTYSYKTTVFYGKAELKGILTLPSKSLIIKETRLIDLRISDKSEPCLMTCYLDYTKMGKLEVLEGNFISVNMKDKRDCGSGKIYLERVANSDFKKEDFLVKKFPDSSREKITGAKPRILLPENSQPTRRDNLATKTLPVKPGNTGSQNPTTQNTQRQVPPAAKKQETKPTVTAKNNPPPKAVDKNKTVVTGKAAEKNTQESVITKKDEAPVPQQVEQDRRQSIPRVLIERENNLSRTINTSEEYIVVELYDNGTIDNDTVSVYHNNQLVVSHGRLTYSPITVKIHCTKAETRHELVLVAENLGDIPPNSALMVVKAGRERHEVFLYSTEQRNAKVVINYIPKE
jgi:hypothetical protein